MDQNAKQQIVDRLKEASNVLVTVSANPSVDQLAACIGMTLFLNKLGKHATAVFSGQVPSTLEFLKPEDTIETNTNSLRDFIIALDKSKADKLRYKVEDQVVKIFITPYRTSITDKDLEFSQGDFNVDVVLGLGVKAREDMDQAIMAHGRILHDATVVSINNQDQGNIGTINWVETQTSSLSEMLTDLCNMLGKDKIDGQMATALLTGIVAQTDRFSNDKTSPQTMSIASELMRAGANQQLIATELENPAPPSEPSDKPADTSSEEGDKEGSDGSLTISHNGNSSEPSEDKPAEDKPEQDKPQDGFADSGGSSKHTVEANTDLKTLLDESAAEQAASNEKANSDPLSLPPILPSSLGSSPSSPAADVQLPPLPSSFPTLSKAEDRTPTQSDNSTRLDDITVKETDNQGKMGANTQPEHLQSEPSTDPFSVPMPTNAPMLDKQPTTFTPPPIPASNPLPTLDVATPAFTAPNLQSLEKLDDIEKEVASPHVTMAEDSGPKIGGETLEEARQAVNEAIQANPNQPLEPLAGVGSQPVNLDLNHDLPPAPQVPTSPAPMGVQPAPFTMPQPDAAPGINPNPQATIPNPIDSSFPPSLVPPAAPVDTTGSNGSPSAPPPVPPPLLPPTPSP